LRSARANGQKNSPSRRCDFCSRLTGAIRIAASERIILPIAVEPLSVEIALVCGDDDHYARAVKTAGGLEHVDRAHDVRSECLERLLIGLADKRLGREMENEIGPAVVHNPGNTVSIANVGFHMTHPLGEP
jgi:hypothetical protein